MNLNSTELCRSSALILSGDHGLRNPCFNNMYKIPRSLGCQNVQVDTPYTSDSGQQVQHYPGSEYHDDAVVLTTGYSKVPP